MGWYRVKGVVQYAQNGNTIKLDVSKEIVTDAKKQAARTALVMAKREVQEQSIRQRVFARISGFDWMDAPVVEIIPPSEWPINRKS